jgi:dephospho-CoA kinase
MSESASRPMRVGLTGGIASGKSMVANMFAARGIPIIDTDILARQIVEPGQPGLAAVVAAFGHDVLRPDGTLDRARLRSVVFADPAKRKQLDELLHPMIMAAAMRAGETGRGDYQIFAVPLLVETNFDKMVDRVLVVDCDPELQRQRLISRDNESAQTADAIIASQATRQERLAIADDVIRNDGTLRELEAAVERLHQQYLAQCAERCGLR